MRLLLLCWFRCQSFLSCSLATNDNPEGKHVDENLRIPREFLKCPLGRKGEERKEKKKILIHKCESFLQSGGGRRTNSIESEFLPPTDGWTDNSSVHSMQLTADVFLKFDPTDREKPEEMANWGEIQPPSLLLFKKHVYNRPPGPSRHSGTPLKYFEHSVTKRWFCRCQKSSST